MNSLNLRDTRNSIKLALFVLTPAIFFIVFNLQIAKFLESILPKAMTVKSSGWMYTGMGSYHGFSWQLKMLGFAGILSLCGSFIWLGFADRIKALFQQVNYKLLMVLISALTVTIYFYLSNPPYIFGGNHWHYLPIAQIQKSAYFLLRSIQQLFFDYPFLFAIVVGLSNIVLIHMLVYELFNKKWLAVLASVSFLISSNMLDFANVSEDVQFNILLILLAFLLHTKRSRYWFGLSVFVLTLGRSQFVLLIFIFIFIEIISTLNESKKNHLKWKLLLLRNRFLISNLFSFLIPYVLWNVYLLSINEHFIFSLSQSSQIDQLNSLSGKEIDGFTIYRFSFAYLLHLIWVMPIVYIAANFAVLFYLQKLKKGIRLFYITSCLFIIGNVILFEFIADWYYNYRYLSYYWPLLLINSYSNIEYLSTNKSKKVLCAFLSMLITLSAATPHSKFLIIRKMVLHKPFSQVYYRRFAIRKITKNKEVYISSTFRKRSSKYLSGILKIPQSKIKKFENWAEVPINAIVFFYREDDYRNQKLVARVGKVFLVKKRKRVHHEHR